MRKFIKVTLAVAALLGFVTADRCAADGSCPAGFHCNEFKFCIAGASTVETPVPVETPVGARCGADGSCPAG